MEIQEDSPVTRSPIDYSFSCKADVGNHERKEEMATAAQDYKAWLARYNTHADRSTDKSQLLVEQASFKSGVTDGKRRGFNGKQPRTTAIALSDCICTRADGTQYLWSERNTKAGVTRTMTQTDKIHAAAMKLPTIHEAH